MKEIENAPAMQAVAARTRALARALLGEPDLRIVITTNTQNFNAAWLPVSEHRQTPELHYSLAALGAAWFERACSSEEGADLMHALILHELGHHYAADHLSAEYHQALTRLGSKILRLALEEPELFR